jgi:hypothetical protein
MAFLSIFPNTEGVTVVIPKDHYGSYAFDLPDEVLANLTIAAKKVGKLLDTALETVGRTGLIYEGFGENAEKSHKRIILPDNVGRRSSLGNLAEDTGFLVHVSSLPGERYLTNGGIYGRVPHCQKEPQPARE